MVTMIKVKFVNLTQGYFRESFGSDKMRTCLLVFDQTQWEDLCWDETSCESARLVIVSSGIGRFSFTFNVEKQLNVYDWADNVCNRAMVIFRSLNSSSFEHIHYSRLERNHGFEHSRHVHHHLDHLDALHAQIAVHWGPSNMARLTSVLVLF